MGRGSEREEKQRPPIQEAAGVKRRWGEAIVAGTPIELELSAKVAAFFHQLPRETFETDFTSLIECRDGRVSVLKAPNREIARRALQIWRDDEGMGAEFRGRAYEALYAVLQADPAGFGKIAVRASGIYLDVLGEEEGFECLQGTAETVAAGPGVPPFDLGPTRAVLRDLWASLPDAIRDGLRDKEPDNLPSSFV